MRGPTLVGPITFIHLSSRLFRKIVTIIFIFYFSFLDSFFLRNSSPLLPLLSIKLKSQPRTKPFLSVRCLPLSFHSLSSVKPNPSTLKNQFPVLNRKVQSSLLLRQSQICYFKTRFMVFRMRVSICFCF